MPVAELLATAFQSIPRRGTIKGSILIMLQGLVSLLQNPQALMEHGQMILDGKKNSHKILEGLFLRECQDQLNAEETEDAEANMDSPPSPHPITRPPVIESHGLW